MLLRETEAPVAHSLQRNNTRRIKDPLLDLLDCKAKLEKTLDSNQTDCSDLTVSAQTSQNAAPALSTMYHEDLHALEGQAAQHAAEAAVNQEMLDETTRSETESKQALAARQKEALEEMMSAERMAEMEKHAEEQFAYLAQMEPQCQHDWRQAIRRRLTGPPGKAEVWLDALRHRRSQLRAVRESQAALVEAIEEFRCADAEATRLKRESDNWARLAQRGTNLTKDEIALIFRAYEERGSRSGT